MGAFCSTLNGTGDEDDSSETGSSDETDSETAADRAEPGARVPLSKQIAACHRRWQWELPEKGAVSLATQHHLQVTTSGSSTSSGSCDGVPLPDTRPLPPDPEPAAAPEPEPQAAAERIPLPV